MKFLKNLIFFIVFSVIALTLIINTLLVYINMEFVQIVLIDERNQSIKMGRVFYRFPLGVTFEDVSMEDKLISKKVLINFDITKLLTKKIKISSCTFLEPVVHMAKSKEAKGHILKELPKNVIDKIENVRKEEQKNYEVHYKASRLVQGIGKLKIVDGKMDYESPDIFVSLDKINLFAENILFPFGSSDIKYTASAIINEPKQFFSKARGVSYGVVNFSKKNMDAKIKITKEKEYAQMTGTLKSENNDLKLEAEFHATKEALDDIKKEEKGATGLMAALIASVPQEVSAKFSLRTKMDDFRMEKVQFEGNFITE